MKNAEVNKSLTVNSEGNITPTLFIGVGGTGAEVLLNLRRNMLSHVWSGGEEVQLSTLSEFPYAEFLCIDLDFSAFRESSKPDRDSLHVQAYFSPNETISKRLDLFKYLGSEERLRSFPLVEEWFPLILRNNEGYERFFNGSFMQIRSISRLYFYDHFWEIKSSIEQSLSNLRNNAVRSDKHSQLRL